MKVIALLTLLLFTAEQDLLAHAPVSLTGKAYRTNVTWKGTSPRGRDQETIIFRDASHFIHLKFARGIHFLSWDEARVVIQSPKPDGTYTYDRLSDVQARLTLSYNDGTTSVRLLHFTSPTGGGSKAEVTFPGGFVAETFFLSEDAGEGRVAPSNISMRGQVSPGQPLIVGFIVSGPAAQPRVDSVPAFGEISQELVIRVVGPSLVDFGIEGFWHDTDFTLFKGSEPAVTDEQHNADWDATPSTGEGLRKIFSHLGAFPLIPGSREAVDVVRLSPGAYTVVCNPPPGDSGGEVLVEIYFLR